jgi:hypothetical protein
MAYLRFVETFAVALGNVKGLAGGSDVDTTGSTLHMNSQPFMEIVETQPENREK